jgi:hypothetical protein
MSEKNEKYWYTMWHTEKWIHDKLKISDVVQIPDNQPVSVYGDTDSVFKDTLIHTSVGIKTIEEFYNSNMLNGSAGETTNGHESVLTHDRVLNWDNDQLYYADVRRIIRHKVSKPKWKLKTKSGKEIIVTGDHSMVVFRDGKKLVVKPSEILKTDKILCLENNI